MAVVSSDEQQIGSVCPEFFLPSVDKKHYSLLSFKGSRALLVVFTCNHCPYAKALEGRILALAHDFPIEDLQVVAICSNDWNSYPEDVPEKLLERWQQKQYGFPYLLDESQSVAQAFGAVCTPDLFLYDQGRKLHYHGRMDDNWKNESLVSKTELKDAIDGLLKGKEPPSQQHPSMGCSIKWKGD